MKNFKLILLGVLMVSLSCGVEDIGKSDCAIDLTTF